MKKLMIIAAVAMAAIASNAAVVSWGSGTLYKNDASGKFSTAAADKVKDGATAYYFDITKAQYDALLVAGDYDATFQKVMAAYNEGTLGTPTTANTAKYTSTVSFNSADYGTEVASTHYAALIYTYNDGKDDLYIANVAQGTIEVGQQGATGVSNLGLNLGGTGGAAIAGWQTAAVPEPTSGLLLLLGMAGLALRRRRA